MANIKFDEATELPVIQFMNFMVYMKAKDEYEKKQTEKMWKKKQ